MVKRFACTGFNRSRKLELLQSGLPPAPFCGGLLANPDPRESKNQQAEPGMRVSCRGLPRDLTAFLTVSELILKTRSRRFERVLDR